MPSKTLQRWECALLVLAAALSIFALAPVMTRPETYQGSLAALQEKQTTVLELTAASTAASAAMRPDATAKSMPRTW